MIKCTMLLPLFDDDGKSLDSQVARILRSLYKTFGSGNYTDHGPVYGCPSEEFGRPRGMASRKITVCVEPGPSLAKLRGMVREFGYQLRQKTMYFEKSLGSVEFLQSDTEASYRPPTSIPIYKPDPPAKGVCAPSLASGIPAELSDPGCKGVEVGGELSAHVVRCLKNKGLQVHVYKHHGVTSTVIRN